MPERHAPDPSNDPRTATLTEKEWVLVTHAIMLRVEGLVQQKILAAQKGDARKSFAASVIGTQLVEAYQELERCGVTTRAQREHLAQLMPKGGIMDMYRELMAERN